MRRYVVRFLVAVLTFGLGVALSLVFGLFKFSENRVEVRKWSARDCPKRFRMARPTFITLDSRPDDPVKLIYLGTINDVSGTEELRLRLSMENTSEKTISGYWITASEIWNTSLRSGPRGLEWTAFEVLEPGESSTISLPQNAEGSSLRVTKVNFEDGSTWTNPRNPQ